MRCGTMRTIHFPIIQITLLCLLYVTLWVGFSSPLKAEITENSKLIALTFDDGPSPYTEDLLNKLAEKQVKATFFVNGYHLDPYGAATERAAAEGHQIANHTWDHASFNDLSIDEIHNEIDRTAELLLPVTRNEDIMLRPPYGDIPEEVLPQLEETIVKWSMDTYDWAIMDSADLTKRLTTQPKDGDIILMHDTVATTPQGVYDAIDALRAKGYEFVTVNELFKAKALTPEKHAIYKGLKAATTKDPGNLRSNCYSFPEENLDKHWAASSITEVKEKGWLTGAGFSENNNGDPMFLPNYPMTRAMFITALWRMDGCIETEPIETASFTDIKENRWYTKAVHWAASMGIIYGDREGCFHPHDIITREAAAFILCNYAGYVPSKPTKEILTFTDTAAISDWTRNAVAALTERNIIKGSTGAFGTSFEAKKYLTRAEGATLLCQYKNGKDK